MQQQRTQCIQTECEKYTGVFCGEMLVPPNTFMDMNNVMITCLMDEFVAHHANKNENMTMFVTIC
jgi:hypothetical protein